jgi:hypothetical protein
MTSSLNGHWIFPCANIAEIHYVPLLEDLYQCDHKCESSRIVNAYKNLLSLNLLYQNLSDINRLYENSCDPHLWQS